MDKIAIVVIILFVLSGCGGIQATRAQPNILIVVLDALRADHVGCYGYERNTTPNLDAFARKCVVYANCYATSSWTKPSVTSLLSGLDCQAHGVNRPFDKLPPDIPYLPCLLQERGYMTGMFAGNPYICRQEGFARGTDMMWQWAPDGGWLRYTTNAFEIDDAVVVNQAIPWIRAARAPWFGYVHVMGPHAPYDKPARAHDFGEEPTDLYDAKLRYVDQQVGRLLAEAPPGTIIIITSDHGEEFGEHGGECHGKTLYDEVLRVPLLIRWPGHDPRRELRLVGLDRMVSAIMDGTLPETGGAVHCYLEVPVPQGKSLETLSRTITEADLPHFIAPDTDAEELRREQLEALGYF